MPNSIITATGSYIPALKIPNEHFLAHDFYGADGEKLDKSNIDLIKKLEEITCIQERRYVTDDLTTSDIAFIAAEGALEGTDRETLDYIIVGQNFGDMKADNARCDMVPTIAARVKHKLRSRTPIALPMMSPLAARAGCMR